ncbi:MAG: hypothetical protein HZC40_03320 [Chloroflexi bacterium]|nr:hypothetical protein [Chloroflexota bacterium]
MATSNSFLSALLDLLARLFGGSKPPPPPIPPESGDLVALKPRVLMITYNPTVDAASGKNLIQEMGWRDADALAQGYADDIRECSGGLVDYQIVARVVVDEFPIKADGFRYQAQDYVNAYRAGSGFHTPDAIDYDALIAKFNLLTRVANNELDEVWLFGFPYIGYWESTMAGKGAFFCNSEPRPNTEACPRRFIMMGFSYERGNGEMLENLGHRAESIMRQVYRFKSDAANLFERFCLYDQIAPGNAQCGNVHFAPNSVRDYDWGNPTPVASFCDDWLTFPNLPGKSRMVDAREWGNGDIREHHKWWMRHFPQVAGVTDGIANNWWKYIADVNNVR